MQILHIHDHRIQWAEGDRDGYRWGAARKGVLFCSCGERGHAFTTQRGKPDSRSLRSFALHAKKIEPEIETPLLVGKIQKQRVEHEVWVFHVSHDWPRTFRGWVQPGLTPKERLESTWLRAQPYAVFYRNSRSWVEKYQTATLGEAIGAAVRLVEDGNGIVLEQAPLSGIPAAPSSVSTVAAELINMHKSARTTRQILDGIKEIDRELAALDSLKALRDELHQRLTEGFA